jgi:hypothetical protein
MATTAYAEGLHHACKGGYLGGTTGKSGKSYKHDTNCNIAPSASRSTIGAINDTRRLINGLILAGFHTEVLVTYPHCTIPKTFIFAKNMAHVGIKCGV